MRVLKALGRLIWRFMIVFSFIVNVVLVIVLVALGIFIFDIKNNVAGPLVGGLHSTAVGLNDATIDWTIPVRDNIPVQLNIPLQTNTIVVLTDPVPLQVSARIDLPGINAYNVAANVNLTLPQGLQLPVALNLNVPVDERLDVSLDVRAVIPISETQLTDPIETLGLLFEPLAIGLHNLPSDFNEAGSLVSKILAGEPINLLAVDGSGGINSQPYEAWQGYSRTAGLNYTLFSEPFPPDNVPLRTGLVPPGGIPALDEQIRPDLYASGGPLQVNQQAIQAMNTRQIAPVFFDGTMGQQIRLLLGLSGMPPEQPPAPSDTVDAPAPEGDPGSSVGGPLVPLETPTTTDFGIINSDG